MAEESIAEILMGLYDLATEVSQKADKSHRGKKRLENSGRK